MTRTNIPEAKNRILQAAIKVFAEKSFEGSRVDEIAKEAKVPKSLIYYHFKSKDQILEVLIRDFLQEYTEHLQRVVKDESHSKKSQEMPGHIQRLYAEFAQKNGDLIRIILMDSLKKSAEQPVIFKIVEAWNEVESRFPSIERQENDNRNERLVAEFFTNIIPQYAYICFRSAWADYLGIEKTVLDQILSKTLSETHGAYHKKHE